MSIRITTWYLKLAYVVGAWLAGYPVLWLLSAVQAPAPLADVVNTGVILASVILGARLFRGRGEPLEAPRPWWQMTARPTLSLMLGIVFALFTVSAVALLLTAALGVERSAESLERVTLASTLITSVFMATLAFLYLNSAIRLRNVPAADREPRFRLASNLK